jgi:glycerol uptake facilitator-like aquaporin
LNKVLIMMVSIKGWNKEGLKTTMNFTKPKVAALLAEFLGTGFLTLVFLSVSNSSVGLPYFTAIAVGLLVSMSVLVLGPISGAHINPAVTLAKWTVRKIDSLQAVLYIAFQVLGALAALRLFEYFVQKSLPMMAVRGFEWRTLIAEGVGTLIFTVGVASALYNGYDRLTSAAVTGMSYMLGIVVASIAANGILNPAVALGLHSFSRGYWIGPAVGALVGMNVYTYFFAAKEMVTPLNFRRPVRAATSTSSVTTKVKSSAASKPVRKAAAKPKARRKR